LCGSPLTDEGKKLAGNKCQVLVQEKKALTPIKTVTKRDMEVYIWPILGIVVVVLILVIVAACIQNKSKIARKNRKMVKIPDPIL
jgi:hypothetical protein